MILLALRCTAVWLAAVASAPAEESAAGSPSRAEAVAAGAADLHCCFAPAGKPLALVCDPGTTVASVDFASYGDASQGTRLCGDEVAYTCGVRIEADLAAQCLGKEMCRPDLTRFGDPCPGSSSSIMVRWSCTSFLAQPSDHNGSLLALPFPSLPLRVEGGLIVDGRGDRFPLRGVNWAGFHIKHAASGLDRAPLDSIAGLIRRLGFNVVRLPWSVQMVLTNPVVGEEWVAANPRLKGLRALSLYDEVVAALGRAGVLVWSDNHNSDSDWCCNSDDCNGLWFNERWSMEQWAEAHRRIARRYRREPALVGLGLRNEPRTVCGGPSTGERAACNASFYGAKIGPRGCAEVHWSSGPKERRWRAAAEYAGRGALAENPNLLVSVSGLDYATDLTGVALDPVRLPASNLVYEAHEYKWFHKGKADDGYHRSLDHSWGHVARDRVAPVFVSEYGFPHDWHLHPSYGEWFAAWAQYVRGVAGPLGSELGGLDWSYWELSGEQMGGTGRTPGATEDFGILNHCWNAPAHESHTAAVQSLMLLTPIPVLLPLRAEALPSAPITSGLGSVQGAALVAWGCVAVALLRHRGQAWRANRVPPEEMRKST